MFKENARPYKDEHVRINTNTEGIHLPPQLQGWHDLIVKKRMSYAYAIKTCRDNAKLSKFIDNNDPYVCLVESTERPGVEAVVSETLLQVLNGTKADNYGTPKQQTKKAA